MFLPYARPLVSYCRGPKGVGGMCCHSSTKGHGRLSSLCQHGYTAVNLNYLCLFKAMPLSRAHRPYTWAYATASHAINLQKSAHRKGLNVRQSDRPILKKKDSICGCNFASQNASHNVSIRIRVSGFAAPERCVEFTLLGFPDRPLEHIRKILACGLRAGN